MKRMLTAASFLKFQKQRFGLLAVLSVLVLAHFAAGADTGPKVELDAKKAGPRAVESLTQNAIVRDYRTAWNNVAHALETNSAGPLDGPFTGEAKTWLWQSVMSQQKTGLSRRYVDQNHRVEAVFYAPEGDVIELHDTADFQFQILDSGKVVQEEHVTGHYVVLMTPSADRWLVRHLQSVQQF
jgi:hypothetical protein